MPNGGSSSSSVRGGRGDPLRVILHTPKLSWDIWLSIIEPLAAAQVPGALKGPTSSGFASGDLAKGRQHGNGRRHDFFPSARKPRKTKPPPIW